MTVCCAAACSTTHVLHLDDPGPAQRLHEMVLVPGTVAQLAPLPGAPPPALKYDVVAPAPGGLLLSDGSGLPTFARYDQIDRVQTIDRPRGARDGLLAVGVPSLFVGVTLGLLVANSSHPDGDSSPSSESARAALGLGAIFTVVGAIAGAAYGAVAGHRDIYLVRP